MAEDKKEKNKLQQLKEKYETLQKKYRLPDFDELNEEFEIEKIKIGSFILKEIRRTIGEKITSVLKLLELLINPVNAPFFVFTLIKNLKPGTKKEIESLYKKLSTIEIRTIRLDLTNDETAEAEFIKDIAKEWQEHKKALSSFCDDIEKAWQPDFEKQEKGYLG